MKHSKLSSMTKKVLFQFSISQVNVVGITRLRTGGTEVRNPAGKVLSSPKRSDCLYSMGAVRWLGHYVGHSPPSSAEVNE